MVIAIMYIQYHYENYSCNIIANVILSANNIVSIHNFKSYIIYIANLQDYNNLEEN